MDPRLPSPTPNPPSSSHLPKKLILIIISCLLLFILVFLGAAYYFGLLPWQKTPSPPKVTEKVLVRTYEDMVTAIGKPVIKKFPDEQAIAKVGEETIYGNDLNFILSAFYSQQAQTITNLEELKKLVLEKAHEDSTILQLADNEGKVALTPDIFNNPSKEQYLRQRSVAQLRSKYETEQVTVDGERVSLWFYNIAEKIPKAEADKLARSIMEKIYSDLKTGKINMVQAGEQIKNNPDSAKLDESFAAHAYSKFIALNGQEVFNNPTLNKTVWQLKEGQLSSLIRTPEKGLPQTTDDAGYYSVIKINKKLNLSQASFTDKLKTAKQKYKLTEL